MYKHPLELSFPSPLSRHVGNERMDSHAGFGRLDYNDLNSHDKFQMSELYSEAPANEHESMRQSEIE